MKFHNQRSFMGHEISNVNNKPLLRKKGKQWIVVAVSALILAGFGGMVSTTTHADTTNAQPTTTKVAPNPVTNHAKTTTPVPSKNNNKPASVKSATLKATQPNTKNIGQQATNLHKNLVNNSINNPNKLNNNKITNNLASVKLTTPTPTSGRAGSDNKATWNISDNTNLHIHGNGVNWYWPNLSPYTNVYISDVQFHGPGHMFSGLTKLNSITFKNVTNNAQYMDNDFSDDTNLQSITGLSDFMDNDSSLIDYDYMFNNCKKLTYLDLSGLNSKSIPSSGQYDYNSAAPYTGDGNHDAFKGMTNLSQIKLGSNTILYPSSQIPTVFTNTNDANASATLLDDGQAHPGNWTVFQGDHGTWGNAHWILNSNGDLLLYNGQLSNVPGGNYNGITGPTGPFNRNDVKHIYTNNVTPPNVTKSSDYSTGAYNLFANFPNVQSIDLSGLNFSGCKVMTDMFYGDSNLQSINFGNNNSDSAALNNTVTGGIGNHNNGLNGFLQETGNLKQITLGSHMILPKNIYNTNNVSSITIFGANQKQPNNITKLTDNNSHPGTWNVFQGQVGNWGTATWALDSKSGTLYLANGNMEANDPGNHGISWSKVKHIETYNVTPPSNMNSLFSPALSKLQSADLRGMNTQYVTDMSHLFQGANNLSSVNVSDLNTSNVKEMISTFQATNLSDLDLSSWNTSNVSDFSSFADGNNNLKVLNLGGNFNTQHAYNTSIGTLYGNGTDYLIGQSKPHEIKLSSNIKLSPAAINSPFYKNTSTNNSPININNGSNLSAGTWAAQATDTINYKNGNTLVSSSEFTGNNADANGASNTSFTVSAPSNYHIAPDTNAMFNYDGGTHNVSVVPNSVTNIIKFSGDSNYSSNVSGLYSTTSSVSAPSGYHYINGSNGNFTYGANGTSYTFSVAPNSATETIDYMYNNSSEGSTTMHGAYNERVNVTSTGINSGFHLSSATSFTYSNGSATDKVNVVPNSITINYMYGNNEVGSYSANTMTPYTVFNSSMDSASAGSLPASSVVADVNSPAGYSLVESNIRPLHFDNNSHSIEVKPNTKTDTINYMYNRTEVSSAKVSGENMYAKYSAFNVSTAPAGYSAVSSNFYYDGELHDVNVEPIRDTDTVDYQVNGTTVASHQFTGYDENATQAGDNSFDANDDIPNGYESVNNDNNFSFDNGTHDVAVEPIPQPAPYIPSMPASSVSSASSAVVAPSSVASQTSVAPSASASVTHHYYHSHYSHYRYAKVITPLQLHTSKHFTDKNGVLVIKHPTEFRIMKIVHDHKYTRYEVKYQGHKYFITGNSKFTINDYVQKHDFKSHKHMMVKVITPMIEYKHAHFSRKYAIRVFKKGAVLPVKRVFTIGKGEMTRFELTNGRYVTSNKLFVKVIK